MKITIEEKEYTVKSKQAIEILDIVEKSGLLEKAKTLTKENITTSNFNDFLSLVPVSYKTAHKVLSIVTGEIKDGKIILNEDLIDNVEAMKLPFLALQVVQHLLYPITYVITSDQALEEEKKSDSPANVDTSPGTKE
jgi:hypothetical protein